MALAVLLYRDKGIYADGGIVEMTIWRLPAADAERPHGLKYSLFYGKEGERIVGYDNERGKGDHRHLRASEFPYRFVSIEQMIADFIADVQNMRSEP